MQEIYDNFTKDKKLSYRKIVIDLLKNIGFNFSHRGTILLIDVILEAYKLYEMNENYKIKDIYNRLNRLKNCKINNIKSLIEYATLNVNQNKFRNSMYNDIYLNVKSLINLAIIEIENKK